MPDKVIPMCRYASQATQKKIGSPAEFAQLHAFFEPVSLTRDTNMHCLFLSLGVLFIYLLFDTFKYFFIFMHRLPF